jgi:hypothetical protein
LTDRRTGENVQYQINYAAQAAFAIFLMQSASFLAGQYHLRQAKGKSNAETVSRTERIPTDSHICNLLDLVHPTELAEEFRFLLAESADSGHLGRWYVLDRRLVFSIGWGTLFIVNENLLLAIPNTSTGGEKIATVKKGHSCFVSHSGF